MQQSLPVALRPQELCPGQQTPDCRMWWSWRSLAWRVIAANAHSATNATRPNASSTQRNAGCAWHASADPLADAGVEIDTEAPG